MTTGKRAFILVDVLVALAVFSLLVLSALGLLGTVSQVANRPLRTQFNGLVRTLRENSSAHLLKSHVTLTSTKRYPDGSVWRVYRFDADSPGNEFHFPVYYPPGERE